MILFTGQGFLQTNASEEVARKILARWHKSEESKKGCCLIKFLRQNGFSAETCKNPLQELMLPNVVVCNN